MNNSLHILNPAGNFILYVGDDDSKTLSEEEKYNWNNCIYRGELEITRIDLCCGRQESKEVRNCKKLGIKNINEKICLKCGVPEF